MLQKLTTILVAIMALVLMVFTASRTLDLLQQLLPAGQGVFAFLGLVAFDGGLLGWSLFFAYGARGAYQRGIALLMVIVSLIAIGITTIADLYLSASQKGIVDAMGEQQRLAVLLAVGGVVFVNVAAFFLAHITHPALLRSMATESANDKIHAKTIELISQRADQVAAKVAPVLTDEWAKQIILQHLGTLEQPADKHIDAKVMPAPKAPSVAIQSEEKETLHLPALKPQAQNGAAQNGATTFPVS